VISSFVRRIFAALLSRFFWVCLGVLLVSVLIWYVGPIVSFGDWRPLESTSARLWALFLLLLFVLLRVLLRRWKMQTRSANLVERLRGMLTTAQNEEPANMSAVRQRFDEALSILRKARFGQGKKGWLKRFFGGGRYLYELPWFIIIGAPGTGKTTALLNSGLTFPLAREFGRGAIRGVGGTRHCDWWFTNEAVLIDTAGRYTTHETDGVADRDEWQGFLRLLRGTRSGQPVNGVLVTLSVDELLDRDRASRMAHASAVRRRLDELRNELGIALPVYVLVSKCDLLSGFDEYFAHLDRSGREQVWGVTLPLHEAGVGGDVKAEVGSELRHLNSRLHELLVDVLQAEHDVQRRGLAFGFPQQHAVLCGAVNEVVDAIFDNSVFSEAPFLRGIYFTSGTQEGTPLDRLVSSLRNLDSVRSPSSGNRGTPRSYFLKELLSDLVFKEAHLAGRNRKLDRRSKWLHVASYALSVLLLSAVVITWAVSYRNNVSYLAEVKQRADNLSERLALDTDSQGDSFYQWIDILSQIETVADSIHFTVHEPLQPWRFGLYQGAKVWSGAQPLYERALVERFVPALKLRLETMLRAINTTEHEKSFEFLKAYLMLHDPEHFDAAELKSILLRDWDENVPEGVATNLRSALARHVDALIALGGQYALDVPDRALIDVTRSRLAQFSFEQRVYRRLLKVLSTNNLPEFSVGSVVGPESHVVFSRISARPLSEGVPALFTYRGYHELFSPEVANLARYVAQDDGWVMGGDNVRDRLREVSKGELALEVTRLYMWDYVKHWERFLEDVQLKKPTSVSEASDLARFIASVDSPLMRYLRAVVAETTLLRDRQKSASGNYSLLDRAKRVATSTQEDVRRLVGSEMLPNRLRPAERPELIVDNRFETLRKALGDGANTSLPAAQTLQELYLYLSAMESARIGGYPPPASDVPNKLQAEAARLPQPARGLLEGLAKDSGGLAARTSRIVKSTQIAGTVTRQCHEAVSGRYPFVRTASKEVAVDDFSRLFGPGGVFDEHFQRELAPVVDTASSPWRLRPGAQGGLGGGSGLVQFERASLIKEAFFRGGAGAPSMNVMIKPLDMDPSITQLTLDIDGQVIRYQHGPQIGHSVRWPGPRGSGQVRLSIEPGSARGDGGLLFEGSWALHRLFDSARIVQGSSAERFTAEIDVGGRKASFEIVAASLRNPFQLRALQEFSCPGGL
jgi:type VI secretion system protein ImpL